MDKPETQPHGVNRRCSLETIGVEN